MKPLPPRLLTPVRKHRFVAGEPRHWVIRKARTRQKVTRTYKRVEGLSRQMARAASVDLTTGIKTFRERISPQALLDAWKKADYAKIMEVIPWDALPEDLADLHDSLSETSARSSQFSINAVPAPIKSELRYDTANPRLEHFLRNQTGKLVVQIKDDTREMIQDLVVRSLDEALVPRDLAGTIKQSVGLYPRLQTAVLNYQASLERQGMKPERVDQLVASYNDRLLTYRAMTIARTETRTAANFGQLAVWRAAADQDLIDRQKAMKVWIVDGKPCEICEPMDGVAVGLDDMWTLNTGDSVEIPNESHPNCLCGMELDFGDAEDRLDLGDPNNLGEGDEDAGDDAVGDEEDA